MTDDIIERPAHYVEGRKFEPIEVIEDWKLDYHLGNALKYISRAGRKIEQNPVSGPVTFISLGTRKIAKIRDLKKAVWYLQREISNLEEGGE